MAADESLKDEGEDELLARAKSFEADYVLERKTWSETLHKKAVEVSARAWSEYDSAKHGGTRDYYAATQISMEMVYALGRKQVDLEFCIKLLRESINERALKPLFARVKALESLQGRLKDLETAHAIFELENRDQPRFRGAYQREASYKRGDWCVFNGSTWACMEDTTDAPGMQTKSWMIAARKGRDGN